MTFSATASVPGLTVYVRPDEIVAHNGTGAHLGAYTLSIFKDGAPLKTLDVPKHWANACVVYEINPDTVVRTPADILAQKLMLPFGNIGLALPKRMKRTFAGPMDNAGIVMQVGITGGREDIGLLAEWSAGYLIDGDPSDMFAAGRAAFSMPMFHQDSSGKPIDLIANRAANTYSTHVQGDPWYPLPPGCDWDLDGAHSPEDEYLAYVTTGKVRHLWALQCGVNDDFMEDAYWSGVAGFSVCAPAQTRKTAWTLRSLGMCVRATQLEEAKGPLPGYLRPSSHWKQILDNQLAWFTKSYMNDPALQVFRCWPVTDTPGFWQQDFLNQSLTLLALWFPEWRPLYIWTLKNAIMRSNGTSGFPPALGTWYYGSLVGFSGWKAMADNFLDGNKNGTINPDWKILTAAQVDALRADQYNGGHPMPVGGSTDYFIQLRATLAGSVWLDRGDLAGSISAAYPELEQCYSKIDALTKAGGYINARTSIAVDAVPPVVVPPVVTPPSVEPPKPPTVPPQADLPITVHGLLLRAQKILSRV